MNIQIIELIGAFLGGGLVQAIIGYFLKKRTEDRSDYTTIIRTWREDNERLRASEIDLLKKLQKLEDEMTLLRYKVVLLESAHQSLPVPMWLKDKKGVMLAVNTAYEEAFLIPNGIGSTKYIGHTDFNVWPEDIAEEYYKNDQKVLRTGKQFVGYETVEVNGVRQKYLVIKYVRYAEDVPIGIAGIAFPEPIID